MSDPLYRIELIVAASIPTMGKQYAIGRYADVMPDNIQEAYSLGQALQKNGFDLAGVFERFFLVERGTGRKLFEIKQKR